MVLPPSTQDRTKATGLRPSELGSVQFQVIQGSIAVRKSFDPESTQLQEVSQTFRALWVAGAIFL